MMLIDTIAPTFEPARDERAQLHRGPRTSGRAYPIRTQPARLVRPRPGGARYGTAVPGC